MQNQFQQVVNNQKDDDEIEIDLIRLIKAFWAKVLTIILVSVVCATGAFAYTYFLVAPTYEANCKVYVNNSSFSIGSSSVSISSGDLSASKSLVDTYIVILQSRTTLNEVIKVADLKCSYSQLLGMIKASSLNDTEVFNIVVTSTDPEEAKLIANTIAQVLPEQVADIVDGTSVRIVDYAVLPVVKSGPSITKNTAIGFIIGFVLICAYICIRDLMDDVIHDEDTLAENVDLPILGVIPDLDEEVTKGYYYYYRKKGYKGYRGYKYANYDKYGKSDKNSKLDNEFINSQVEFEQLSEEEKKLSKKMQKSMFGNMSFAASEAYKLLRTNLNFIDSENSCKVIGITSSTRGEGKSTTSLNLSYTLAETGKRVLLIDADLRIPSISKRLCIEQEAGLSAVLAGLTPVETVLTSSKIFKNWHVLPAGVIPPNPNELLGLLRTKVVFESLSQDYDYIIVDLPPVNIVADALTLSGALDGIVVVARQDYSSLVEIKEMINKFKLIGSSPLGFVLTDVADRSKGYKYSKYRRYAGYSYKKDRYYAYGYSSYYDKRSYPDPRIYAQKARKEKEEKLNPKKDNLEEQTVEKKGLL